MCIYSSMEFITLYTDCLGAWKWAQGGYDYLMQRGVILHNNSTVKKKKKKYLPTLPIRCSTVQKPLLGESAPSMEWIYSTFIH